MKQDIDLLRTASQAEQSDKMAIAEDNEQLTIEEREEKMGWPPRRSWWTNRLLIFVGWTDETTSCELPCPLKLTVKRLVEKSSQKLS